jgi:hypothetical protein
MPHWELLLIPLIALGVWILSTIFRSVEDEREKNRPRRSGEQGNRPRPTASRRPVTDLDRFLEDARRRREGPPRRAPEPRPAPRVERPVSRPVPTLEALPAAVPTPRSVPEVWRAPVPQVLPVAPPPLPLPEIPLAVPPPAGAARPARPVSPFLTQLAGLLQKKDSLRAALVLREIFDRPLCDRPRSRE